MAIQHTPSEMFNNLDYASNRSDRLSGRVDALAHVGMLVRQDITEEQLTDIQAEILDPEDNDPAYIAGYEEAWNALFNLVYGRQPNELHKEYGPVADKRG